MMRIINGAVISLFALLLLAGCSDTPEPAPVDTVLGAPTAPGGYGSDWSGGGGDQVNPSGFGGQDQGLTPRDASGGGLYGSGRSGGGSGGVGGAAFESVYFGFDQFSIRPSERAKLERAANYLRQNPNQSFILEGHTDSIGTTEYNLGLSDRRANSVRAYLEQLGVSGQRLQVLPMGSLNATPNVTRNSPQAEHDRRVDLIPN